MADRIVEVEALFPIAAPLPFWTGGVYRWATDEPPGTYGSWCPDCNGPCQNCGCESCGGDCEGYGCHGEDIGSFANDTETFQAQVFFADGARVGAIPLGKK